MAYLSESSCSFAFTKAFIQTIRCFFLKCKYQETLNGVGGDEVNIEVYRVEVNLFLKLDENYSDMIWIAMI